jgi:hypothetical protein
MDMKTNEVKALLQKYYDGLTTPQEESNLEAYFINNQTDSEFETDRLHFLAVGSMRDEDIPVPPDLESSVLSILSKEQKSQKAGNRKIIYLVLSVAAGLLLMVSTFVFLSGQNKIQTITDPGIAYAESRQALVMVSKFFNEGTSQLSGLGKLNQAVQPLGKLNTLDRAAKTLTNVGRLQNK